MVYTSFTMASDDQAYAIALQPDGRILLAGQTFDGQGIMSVARYNNPSLLAPVGIPTSEVDRPMAWPNPTDGTLHVRGGNSGSAARIVVNDLMGRPVHTSCGLHPGDVQSIDLSGLSKGCYILQVFNDTRDSPWTVRIAKQ
jgi:hypothetical protein